MLNGKRVAFDYGSARIGVAASDNSGILVSPLDLIKNDESLYLNLNKIIGELSPIYIAIGIPSMLSGNPGSNHSEVLAFIEQVRNLTKTRIFGIDERLSTVNAASKLRASGIDSKSAKNLIDSASAVGILELAMELEKAGNLDKCEI
jgi:putative holliday junction resolvase